MEQLFKHSLIQIKRWFVNARSLYRFSFIKVMTSYSLVSDMSETELWKEVTRLFLTHSQPCSCVFTRTNCQEWLKKKAVRDHNFPRYLSDCRDKIKIDFCEVDCWLLLAISKSSSATSYVFCWKYTPFTGSIYSLRWPLTLTHLMNTNENKPVLCLSRLQEIKRL